MSAWDALGRQWPRGGDEHPDLTAWKKANPMVPYGGDQGDGGRKAIGYTPPSRATKGRVPPSRLDNQHPAGSPRCSEDSCLRPPNHADEHQDYSGYGWTRPVMPTKYVKPLAPPVPPGAESGGSQWALANNAPERSKPALAQRLKGVRDGMGMPRWRMYDGGDN